MGTLMKGAQEGEVERMYGNQVSAIPVEAFDQEDRERVLELLLSQERVVTLLYSKVFPAQTGGGKSGKGGTGGAANASLEELLHSEEDVGDERPGTTGGLPSGIPGANPSTRPHTLPAPDESGSNL